MWGTLASLSPWGSTGVPSSSAFPSCAAALNRLRDASELAAAEHVLALASAGQLEDVGKGLHILVKTASSLDPSLIAVSRASLHALAVAVAASPANPADELPYPVLLNRQDLSSRPDLLSLLVSVLRSSDLWLRFHALSVLLALDVPPVRGAVLAAPEGPRLVADTVKDARDAVRSLAVALLARIARDCYVLAQLACYGGAFDDLFAAVSLAGGIDGSGASGALVAMRALLEGNSSNKAHFVLTGGLAKLAPLLVVDSSDLLVVTDARAEGLVASLGVVAELCAPDDPFTKEAQTAVHQQQALLLAPLARLALGRLPAVSVRLAGLAALSAAVRGYPGSFATLSLPDVGSSAVDRAVAILLSPQAVLSEAQSAVRLVECFLWRNAAAQLEWAARWGDVQGGPAAAARLFAAAADAANPVLCWLATHVLAAVLRDSVVAQQTAFSRGGSDAVSALCLAAPNAPEAARLPRLARLRLLATWAGQCRDVAAAVASGNRVAALVECVLSATSDAHVAAAAAIALRRVAAVDTPTRDVLLRRVGADKFLSCFRGVLRTREWEDGIDAGDDVWQKDVLLLYPPFWRHAFRDEFALAKAQFEPASAAGGADAATAALEKRAARAEEELAASRAEIERLKTQLVLATAAPPPPAAVAVAAPAAGPPGMEVEMLRSRDAQIASLRKDLQTARDDGDRLRQENERLLVLLADQEIALNKGST